MAALGAGAVERRREGLSLGTAAPATVGSQMAGAEGLAHMASRGLVGRKGRNMRGLRITMLLRWGLCMYRISRNED